MSVRRAGLGLAVALLLAGCDGGPPPGRQVTATSTGLSYQVKLARFDGTDTFDWNVDAEQAYVRYDGTSLTHGTVQLTFLDAAGAVVLRTPIATGAAPQSGPTSQGKAGPWTVRLDFSDAEGNLAFTAAPAR